ncbi:putative MFS transporter, AGZA family, xanthine/uracil permease [Candidatus Frackibacter sp. WG12]|uniref:NCS2 family permease n=1 Tax=Candidatus Frackibacter sp. WG12 TaxID=2017977 RepID=UPI0008C009FE|nr:NCS2 family permease [Candidatus Frackibacter sp. WG12]SEM48055.1 putative MFS transporter, AGZA family, xanthine/uracil permease [Candidatus Frackibacter sp. WG12]
MNSSGQGAAEKGLLEKLFKLKENNTTVKTEIIAGLTTFMTMAYIIIVNPIILKDAGMPFEAVMAATVISAAFATLIMGLYANYPFALAPGMGLNAFFTYTVVLGMGLSWQAALAAVFVSGIFFILITITGIRTAIVNAIPTSLKRAVSAGIGLFIALIGLSNANIIVADKATLISLTDNLAEPNTLLALIGLVIIGVLMAKRVKGSILIGIIITTIIGIPLGVVEIKEGFSPFALKFNLETLGAFRQGIPELMNFGMLNVILAFTFVDLFDTIGTLVGTGARAGMLDEDGNLPKVGKALMADSLGTTFGSILGTSTVTTYVESTAGIVEGGRTGLTAVTVAVLFLASLVISPLVLLVPEAATAPALIIVGVLMMGAITDIDFEDFTEAFPAFMTIVMMPFAYSIAEGIAAGIIIYPVVKLVAGRSDEVHPMVYILALLFIARYIFM